MHAFDGRTDRIPIAIPRLHSMQRGKNQGGGCKNGTDVLCLHAKFGGDLPLHGGVRNKSWMFVLFCFDFFVCHALDLEQSFK